MRTKTILFLLLLPLAVQLGCGRKDGGPFPFDGKVTQITGIARIQYAQNGESHAARLGGSVGFGDTIITGGESQVEISFGDSNLIRIAENTKAAVTLVLDSGKTANIEIFNFFGNVFSNIGKITGAHSYRVRTPTALASIRGTCFWVIHEGRGHTSSVNVVEGHVWVSNPKIRRKVLVLPGYCSFVAREKTPSLPRKIRYAEWKKMEKVIPAAIFKKHEKKWEKIKKENNARRALKNLLQKKRGKTDNKQVLKGRPGSTSVKKASTSKGKSKETKKTNKRRKQK